MLSALKHEDDVVTCSFANAADEAHLAVSRQSRKKSCLVRIHHCDDRIRDGISLDLRGPASNNPPESFSAEW